NDGKNAKAIKILYFGLALMNTIVFLDAPGKRRFGTLSVLHIKTYELKKIDMVAEEPKKECSLSLKAELEYDDEEIAMFVQRIVSPFKKAMNATWVETSNVELEGDDVENDNLALMTRSDLDSDNDSTKISLSDLKTQESEDEHEIGLIQSSAEKVSAPALTEGTVMEVDSLNVPSESRQDLENSRGINPEKMDLIG
ncbi:hypothetical protein HAX54_037028, partial [Datura stramonium]|nr:hypothetical protein [Datura stramonium]